MKFAWRGTVEVFDLLNHKRAKRADAWQYKDGNETKTVAVLEIPPWIRRKAPLKWRLQRKRKNNAPMPSIRISETEILDAKRIKSFTASEQDLPEVAGREMVLTITKTDGEDVTLRGDVADAALAILRLHGF
jgi:hypothetical protein